MCQAMWIQYWPYHSLVSVAAEVAAPLVCHVGLGFIVCADHCSLRSKRGTWDSWNLLKWKRLTSLCMFIIFSFLSYILQISHRIGLQAWQSAWQGFKGADEEMCLDTPALLCSPARLGPGPALKALCSMQGSEKCHPKLGFSLLLF